MVSFNRLKQTSADTSMHELAYPPGYNPRLSDHMSVANNMTRVRELSYLQTTNMSSTSIPPACKGEVTYSTSIRRKQCSYGS